MGEFVGAGVLIWMAALCRYDVVGRRLPNWLTLPGAAVILVVAAAYGRGGPASLGAAALFGMYLLVHLVAPAAMGAGDVKLALGIGALTGSFGFDVWTVAAAGAPLFTAAVAGAAAMRRTVTVPHGPSMCLSALAATALAVV